MPRLHSSIKNTSFPIQKRSDEVRIFNRMSLKGHKTIVNQGKLIDLYKKVGIDMVTQKKLLEIGCGEGVHCNLLMKFGYRTTGVDISKEAIKKAKKLYRKPKFYVMAAQELGFEDETFDAVLFWGSLHHFYYSDMAKVLNEAIRVTKKGGKLFVVEPNDDYFWNWFTYTLAHCLNHMVHIDYLKNTFSENEHSLIPQKVLGYLTGRISHHKLSYFDYINEQSKEPSFASPHSIMYFRRFFDRISKLLVEKNKYDFFSIMARVL